MKIELTDEQAAFAALAINEMMCEYDMDADEFNALAEVHLRP